MSSTLVCPFCSAETPFEHNFCIFCDQQIKCLNAVCGKKLVPGKTFCFGCGQTIAKIPTAQSQPNKYIRDVKQSGKTYEEHTEFSLSDHAVSEIAPFVVGQMMSRPPKPPHPGSFSPPAPFQQPLVDLNDALPEAEVPQLPEAIDHQPLEANGAGAVRYFARDGEYLIVEVKDFKGSTWADQQKRFILLYVSAYNRLVEQPVPSKEHLRKAAEKASILDSKNFTKYIGEVTRKYLSEISGGYKLNQDGEKEIKNILAQIEDENVEPGNKYWERSTSATTKRQRFSKDDKIKIQEWAQEEVCLDNFKVRDIRQARDYALLSLWILTVHLKKADAVRWNYAYYYLKEKFTTISVEPESFSRAISKSINDNYFRKTGDSYFLSSEGQQKVEGWIAGKPIESSDDLGEDGGN